MKEGNQNANMNLTKTTVTCIRENTFFGNPLKKMPHLRT